MNTLRKTIPLLLLSAATASAGVSTGYLLDSDPIPDSAGTLGSKASAATCYYSGMVVDDSGKPLAGASVSVNGVSRTTSTNGEFYLTVTCSSTGKNILNASGPGRVPVSRVYVESMFDIRIVLRAAYSQTINPTQDNVVKDPSTGASVTLYKNTLLSSSGSAPSGNVTVTVGYYTPGTMLGDLTARTASNAEVFLESVGALYIGASDSTGKTYNLKSGSSAIAYVPVPADYNKQMPSCVSAGTCRLAMWRYSTVDGLWYEKSASLKYTSAGTTFTLVGGSTANARHWDGSRNINLTANGGLGFWNADLEKQNPACTVVELVDFPASCYNPAGASIEPGITLSSSLPTTSGTYIGKAETIGSDAAAVVLYNILENKDMKLSLSFPSGAPSSCANYSVSAAPPSTNSGYTVNSGPRWGGTGYPKDPTDGKAVTLQDIAAGNHPCNSEVVFKPVTGVWSQWYDRDDPSVNGDYETLSDIIKLGLSCTKPIGIECQALDGRSWTQTGEVYTCDPAVGGVCENSKQSDRSCIDYKVRFLCP